MAPALPFLFKCCSSIDIGEIMNSRIIKAYSEMKKSQQNTPLKILNPQSKKISQKAKCCLGSPKPNNVEQSLQK